MFGQKTLTGTKFKAVAHERINDITFETGMVFGVLTIDTPQEKFNVALNKQSATSINNHIHQVLDEVKTGTHTQVITNNVSSADELKKFKELLDLGIITQEEFDAKKKQLLSI